jgi:DNA-binding MarR family transcriptional regulator
MAKKSSIERLMQTIEAFRQVNRDILANEILAFLVVAAHDKGDRSSGVPLSEIRHTLGLSNAATSRNVNFLSQHGANERDGAKLVIMIENPENRRERLVYLTPKGKAFKRQLETLIDGAS